MAISVIIPVHNSCGTLERCVDSVLNQTYKNLEVILVENGSRDASLQMCNDYAGKDPRVKVLSLQTSGISKARNAGLEVMTGEYFAFVDSDDFIEPEMLEKLFTKAESGHVDMTFCRVKNFKTDGTTVVSKENKLKEVVIDKNIQYFLKYGDEHIETVVWRILYRSDKFGKLRFNERMLFAEDADYLFNALDISEKNVLVDEPLYNYLYLYDNFAARYDKYYANIEAVIETYGLYINSIQNHFDRFGLTAFLKAAIFSKYLNMVTLILKNKNYRKITKALKNDEFWKNVSSKENYKQFKKHYSGRKLRLKAYLVKTKQYALYRFLDKLSKKLSGK